MTELQTLPYDIRKTLAKIVTDWIDEGFETPPYEPAHYDIFEGLGINPLTVFYNIQRPNHD